VVKVTATAMITRHRLPMVSVLGGTVWHKRSIYSNSAQFNADVPTIFKGLSRQDRCKLKSVLQNELKRFFFLLLRLKVSKS
jgi:hypothetical protein